MQADAMFFEHHSSLYLAIVLSHEDHHFSTAACFSGEVGVGPILGLVVEG